MKAQDIPSDIEASFTDKKKKNNTTVVENFKVNTSIQFKISNICDSLMCYGTREKSWKKVSLETVKKYCTNLNFFLNQFRHFIVETLL